VSLWNYLVNTLLLNPFLDPYWRTDRQTDRQRNKYARYTWAGGTFFQLCCCVSFLVVVEIVLGDTYLPYQLCHCIFFFVAAGNIFWLHRLVFWWWREKVLGVSSYFLTYHTSCAVVPVFWLRREIVFGYSVSKKDSYLVSLIERGTASKCVYFVKSNTLLLCVFLLSIYLLYQKDQ
jgi:hypothetical protein